MPLPITVTTSGVSASNVVPLDYKQKYFSVSTQVIVTGTVTYTLQYTLDDIFSSTYSAGSGHWFDHPQMSAQTTSGCVAIDYPIRAVRINQTAGSGSTVATILQSGRP